MKNNRRSFLRNVAIGGIGVAAAPTLLFTGGTANAAETAAAKSLKQQKSKSGRAYNSAYSAEFNNRIAFPIGGIGAGMIALEGTGAISHASVRHNPEMFLEPAMFAAISIKGHKEGARVVEGMVPEWKKFGARDSGLGGTGGATWGLPRFERAVFNARFPFGEIALEDGNFPVKATVKGWSPFIPNDEDNASLPVGALEYTFTNTGSKTEEYLFSYNSRNFMWQPDTRNYITGIDNGFILAAEGTTNDPQKQGEFAIFTDAGNAIVNHCWFRGGWFDGLTMIWNTIQDAEPKKVAPVDKDAPGASLFVPFSLKPGQQRTIRVMMSWYVPNTKLRMGIVNPDDQARIDKDPSLQYHRPWYSSKFKTVQEVAKYWENSYSDLYKKTRLFTDTFYDSSLPDEVTEAVAANLTILKSPTVMRQYDGRFWCWEGCGDTWGSCHGSCTHVWNYAQAVSHLFPALERSLRQTEFNESQNAEGHQMFRSNLPITPVKHDFHAAADGQLGGIMKVYREWRISGDNAWLKTMYPKVKQSFDFCSKTWDPKGKGIVEEPHHNTYDIEFWGPTGFATSFYLGAAQALVAMGKAVNADVRKYEALLAKGRTYIENELYDGEYFVQKIQWKDLQAPDPTKAQSFHTQYTPEALEVLQKEGPKYQYGTGCLSDGVMGAWMSRVCGLKDPFDSQKIKSHLVAVHKYNYKPDLREHANPQRPTFAIGEDGGLLLCSWPKGGMLSLPFVYSNEVWTGIEYQVASHLMLVGEVEKGLDIVRACRDRYDGRVRNPFNEYECGHWYARALSSYAMLEALTGARYDAVDKTLHIDSQVGDFNSFLSTNTGFGTVTLKNGKASLKVVHGTIPVKKVMLAGKPVRLS
ncbi:GH116 family glycosyl hydrolase [Pedobacter sp. SYP-B3415]|uniref:GH116 family glycosyl hydrolase n=1 Tax=Pedobacter sp. SYP-B3415 TaxID=2496641 RepID=UPI00101D5260|nr:GH116 family glycosyl hydrolase [Pedobacter sp. SYP-B3415]